MEEYEAPRRGRPSNANAYLRNADLLEQIRISKHRGAPTDELVGMFILLCDRAIKRLRYADPQDEEDCKSAALMDLIKYYHNFDENRGTNAFAYCTQIFKNGAAKGFKQLYDPNMKTVSLTALHNLEYGDFDD